MSIRFALLAMLDEAPKYGLELKEDFEQRTGEVWPLNVGQVYATLQRLERGGLVAPDLESDEPKKKRYRILPAGSRALQDWLTTPGPVGIPDRDELVMRILVAMTVPGLDVGQIIQSHRRRLVQTMQTFTLVKADEQADLALLMVADAEIFRADAAVRWLDACESRLRDRAHSLSSHPPTHPANPTRGEATT